MLFMFSVTHAGLEHMVSISSASCWPCPVQPGHHLQLCRDHMVLRSVVRHRWRGCTLHRFQNLDLGPLHMAIRWVHEHMDDIFGCTLLQVRLLLCIRMTEMVVIYFLS